MTAKEVFSPNDINKLLRNISEVIFDGYLDKLEMRDIALLNWYMMMFMELVRSEYDKKTGDV